MARLIALSLAVMLVAISNSRAAENCDISDNKTSDRQVCTCVAVATPGQPIGKLLNVEGNVQKSGSNGYTPVKASTPIFVGDSVLVGDKSSALLTVGQCRHLMGPHSSFVVRESRGCGCVAALEAGTGEATSGGAIVAVGAGAGLLLLAGHSNPASP